jgi:hypothetical protein
MTNAEVQTHMQAAADIDWERNLRYSFAAFFIVINFYKQVIALVMFVGLVLYVKKVIEIQAERRRNYHYC